jgi:hypothetical protein
MGTFNNSRKIFSVSFVVAALCLTYGYSMNACASAGEPDLLSNSGELLQSYPASLALADAASDIRAQSGSSDDSLRNSDTQSAASGNLPAWTIMVYMAGDNNLEGILINNLLEMEQALPPNVEIIVQLDRSRGFVTGYGNWTGARIYRVRRNSLSPDMHSFYARKSMNISLNITSQLLEELGDINSGDPVNIENFVRYVSKRFPAQRYAFVSMDHGGGWHSNMGDDEHHTNMTIGQLTGALKKGAADLPRGRFDLVIYDMCLMGQMDVAYETASVADYMVASPPSIPSYATDYVSVLPFFTADISSEDLGRKIVELNTRFFNYFNGVSENAAFSLYDLSKVPDMLDAVHALASKLKKHAETDTAALTVNTSLTYHYSDKAFDDFIKGKYMFSSLDLDHWMKRLQKVSSDFDPEIRKVREAMKKMVIAAEKTDDFNYPGGIGIYVPLQRVNVYDGYFNTEFSSKSGMSEYLAALFSSQEKIAANESAPVIRNIQVGTPRFLSDAGSENQGSIEIVPSDTVVPMSGTSIKFEISGKNILGSTISQLSWNKTNPETKYLNFIQLLVDLNRRSGLTADDLANDSRDIMPDYVDGSNVFVREMTGQKYMISDGSKLYNVTVFHNNFEFEKLAVRGLYRDMTFNGEIPVIAFFDATTRKIVEIKEESTGKTIVPALNATLKAGTTTVRNLSGTPEETGMRNEYSEPIPLSVMSLILSNLSDDDVFVYKIDSTSIWGKFAKPEFSRELKVSNSTKQLEMIANLKSHSNEIFDTYAVGYYAGDPDSGMTMLPTFDQWTLVASEKSKRNSMFSSPAWHNSTGRHGQLFFTISNDRHTPVEMRFSLADDTKDNLYRDNMTSYQAYMDSSGRDRVLYLTGIGTGIRLALYPLSGLNRESLLGTWIADTHRMVFTENTVTLDYFSDSHPELKGTYRGSYEVRDNVVTVEEGKFPEGMDRMAFIHDRAIDYLVLKGRSRYLLSGTKTLSEENITLPEFRKQVKGSWTAGEGDNRVDLMIDQVDDTRYLRFAFSFKGTKSEAYATVGDGVLYMNYAGGSRDTLKFSYRDGKLILKPGAGDEWVFSKN